MGKPSQNYTGCHRSMVLTILLAARHKRAHPALTPAGEGWYLIYLPQKDGRLS